MSDRVKIPLHDWILEKLPATRNSVQLHFMLDMLNGVKVPKKQGEIATALSKRAFELGWDKEDILPTLIDLEEQKRLAEVELPKLSREPDHGEGMNL